MEPDVRYEWFGPVLEHRLGPPAPARAGIGAQTWRLPQDKEWQQSPRGRRPTPNGRRARPPSLGWATSCPPRQHLHLTIAPLAQRRQRYPLMKPQIDTCQRIGVRHCAILPCVAGRPSGRCNFPGMTPFHVKLLESATGRSAVDRPYCRAHSRDAEIEPVQFAAASRRRAHCATHRLSEAQPWRLDQRNMKSIDSTAGPTMAGRGERRPLRLPSVRTRPQPQRSVPCQVFARQLVRERDIQAQCRRGREREAR